MCGTSYKRQYVLIYESNVPQKCCHRRRRDKMTDQVKVRIRTIINKVHNLEAMDNVKNLISLLQAE
jgi:hypothetical protein